MGSSSRSASGSASSPTRDAVYTSEKPRAASVSSTLRRSRCVRVRRPTISRRTGSVKGTSASRKRATSSIRSTSRVRSRARHVGTTYSPSRRSLPNRARMSLCSSEATSRPMNALALSGRKRTTGRSGRSPFTSLCPTHASSAQPDDQLGRPDRGVLGEVRVDALFPAVRPLGPEPQALRRPPDSRRLEVGSFEQHLGRRLGDLGFLTAYDPCERDRSLVVGDHQVRRVEVTLDAVQRPQLLAELRAPDDDLPTREISRSRTRAAGSRARASRSS